MDKGVKNYTICDEYKISSSTVSTILKNKEKIENHYQNFKEMNGNWKWKRVKDCGFKNLEETVYAWLCQKISIGETVSGILLQEKAKFFYEKIKENGQLPEDQSDFKASNGWLTNFKQRYSLRTLQAKGEKASANVEASENFVSEFRKFCQDNNYELENVYNADETGLQYRSLPERTLVLANEREESGHKPIKDRLTVMVCSNATGCHRIPPLLIGKSAKPRRFQKNEPLPLHYQGQKKAWMDSKIFHNWFETIFLKNVRELKPDAR